MNWLESMVLQTKLIILTGIMVIAMIILGWMGLTATASWESDVIEVGEVRVPSLIGVGSARNAIKDIIIQQNRVRGINGHPRYKEIAVDAVGVMQEGFERTEKALAIYAELPQSAQESVEWNKFEKSYAEWKAQSVDFQKNIVQKIAEIDDQEEITALFARMTIFLEGIRNTRTQMYTALQNIYDINKQVVADTNIRAKENASSYKQMFMIVAFVSIIFAVILAWLLIHSITRAITQSVTSIRDGALQITSASDQVASSSSSLAQGASEQASSVEEVSATLEESTAINNQNTDNARQADILAKNANDSARAGYEKGEQLSTSMHSITDSAAKISGIIKAIDQIAFQTNLLALNAAVEAARAGEHGLGFAVVADEVRNLAQRAASAAKETSTIIEEVVEQIKEGNEIALATHTSFQDIVEQSKKVSDLIGEISIAGKEQSEGMGQINQAMGQVDQVTQQVAANSEEAAAAAEELNAQATSMMDTVTILAQMVGMKTDTPLAKVTQKKSQNQVSITHPQAQVKSSAPKKTTPSQNSAEDIFPLNEDDLKEF